ncbi:MAG: nucleotidyltransferase [Planctomycetes bacterium]|nr:nucleotidyltransferase [Planctomycetota bacterium]
MATIPHLKQDFKEFIELLNSAGVKYVLVGAYAVAHHGAPRYTSDIDFLIEPSLANAQLVLQVLNTFGFASLRITETDLSKANQIVQLGVKPNRIDLLTSISGVSFDQAYDARVNAEIDGVLVPILGCVELIRNKRSSGRPKDVADAVSLERIQEDSGA